MNSDFLNQLQKDTETLLAKYTELLSIIAKVEEEERMVDKEKALLKDRKVQLDVLENKLQIKMQKIEKILGE